jgi:hypothetical protein
MNIDILQNIVVDRNKLHDLVKDSDVNELSRLLGVKNGQAYYVRRGERPPTIDGLLRLMMLHNLQPGDLAALQK